MCAGPGHHHRHDEWCPGAGSRRRRLDLPGQAARGGLALRSGPGDRLGDSDLFGDDYLDELDHCALWCNLVHWVSPAVREPTPRTISVEYLAAWAQLRARTDALASLQAADGSLAGEDHAAQEHVVAMLAAIDALAGCAPGTPPRRTWTASPPRFGRRSADARPRPPSTARLDARHRPPALAALQ